MQIHIAGLTLHAIQFAAIIGDLDHKKDVYLLQKSFDQRVTCLFSNCEQGWYLTAHEPSLIPPGNWNEHSLGTFFEYFYFSNLTFRFDYLESVPHLFCTHCA